MPYAQLDAALLDIGRRIDQQRQGLYYLDAAVLGASPGLAELGREARAMAYVGGSAALEAFVSAVLDAVVSEVVASDCTLDQLRLSMFALVCDPELEGLRTRRRLTVWEQRSSMFERVSDQSSYFVDTVARPLDGRTLRAAHFETIWRVFGFSGAALPGGIHVGALEDLATNRNAVAHGEVDPQTVGRRKTFDDVLRMLQRVEEVGVHLHSAADRYLDDKLYRR